MSKLFLHHVTVLEPSLPFWTILEQASQYDWQNTLVLVSTHAMKSKVLDALSASQSNQHPLPTVMTLEETVFYCENEYPNSSHALEITLLNQVIRNLSKQIPLDKFYTTSGFRHQFLEFLNIHSKNLLGWKSIPREDAPILKEISDLFDALCEKSGIVREASIFKKAQQSSFSKLKTFFKKKHLYLYGFQGLTPFQKLVFSQIFPETHTVSALLVSPPASVFKPSEMALFLEQFPFETRDVLHFKPTKEFPLKFKGEKHDSIMQECQSIISKISLYSTDLSIGVVIPNPIYKQLLSQLCNDANIPYQPSASFSLAETPFFAFLSATFNLLSSPNRASVLRFFSSPFIHEIEYENRTYAVSPPLIQTLSSLDGDDSLNFWIKSCDSFYESLQHLDTPTTFQSHIISAQKKVFEVIFSFRNHLNNAQNFQTYKATWNALFNCLKIASHITSYPYDTYRNQALIAFTSFFTLMESLYSATRSTPFNATQFSQQFFEFLGHSKLNTPIQHCTGLRFLDMDAAWESIPTIVFIPGLNTACWPGRHSASLSLTSTVSAGNTVDYKDFINEKQLNLFLLLNTPSELHLSYCEDLSSLFIKFELGNLCQATWHSIKPDIKTTYSGPKSNSRHFPEQGFLYEKTNHLWKQQFSKLMLSASQLELFQKCPFRYFMRYVLSLQPYDELKDDVDAAVWGTILHTIFFKLLLDPSLPKKETALSIFNAEAKDSFYWDLKKELLFGKPNQPGLLDQWEELRQTHAKHLKIQDLEFKFTYNTKTPLKGIVDAALVDSEHKWLIIWDYKTGKTIPTSASVQRFESLQLPLYVAAMSEKYPELTVAGAVIFHVHHPNTASYKVVYVHPDADKALFPGIRSLKRSDDGYLTRLHTHISTLSAHIEDAHFSEVPAPFLDHMPEKSTTCAHCDYSHICSYKKRFEGVFS